MSVRRRGRRVPGLEPRHRRGQRPRGRRRRAGDPVARGHRPGRRRRRAPAGRLRLRRLPAGRRHRPVQPGHARGRGLRGAAAAWCSGICNGFQVLAEAGLLPGALLRNRGLRFVCREVAIAAERLDTPFTRAIGERRPLRMPVAHGEGCYFADDADARRARARRPGPVPLRRRRRHGGRPGGPRQPERLAARDRRRRQRRRQRRRADAPPGDGRRGDPRARPTGSGSSARSS